MPSHHVVGIYQKRGGKTMAKNKRLSQAKDAKNDEFYTRYEDIQSELNHYEEHFKNKIVLCNCDDPFESNFCKFFLNNFNYLGLKRLICTSYSGSPVIGQQLSLFDDADTILSAENGYVMDITEVPMSNGRGVSNDDINRLLKSKNRGVKKLKYNGDFRSNECIEYLKQSDIIVTNPPFSLFKEYVAQLMEYDKKFIIIGTQNAITYKEIFPLFKDNKIWLGNGFKGNVGFFESPYQDRAVSSQHKDGLIRVSGVMWFTNLDIKKRHEGIDLFRRYKPDNYPKYVNFDGIDVNETSEIPCDYEGIMGVPKTFMDKYNPEQFEILGFEREDENIKVGIRNMPEEFLNIYRSQGGTGHYTKGMKMLCFFDSEGKAKIPFSRILIRNKHPKKGND